MMGLKKLKTWFKTKPKQPITEDVVCKNCETQFRGHFCPECGQSVNDYDKPFSFIFYNFVGDFFAFDTRLLRTIAALLVKPGFLTKEYFEGRRIRYTPPFRIFIFVSFVLFFLLQIYTNRGLTTVLDSDLKNSKMATDTASLALADSIISQVKTELDSSNIRAIPELQLSEALTDSTIQNLNFKINMETFRDTRDLRQVLNKFADNMEASLDTITDVKTIAKKREYIRLCRSPEQAVSKILEYTSWAFFFLLPIFALILKLVYFRRKHNYMRHLVFSIHIHSFIFIVLTTITALYLVSTGSVNGVVFHANVKGISTFFMFLVPVYIILALKKFYGQKTGKVILKFFAVSFIYNSIFWVVIGIVFLNALSII